MQAFGGLSVSMEPMDLGKSHDRGGEDAVVPTMVVAGGGSIPLTTLATLPQALGTRLRCG